MIVIISFIIYQILTISHGCNIIFQRNDFYIKTAINRWQLRIFLYKIRSIDIL